MPRLELFPFRYLDPRTGKWIRARYVATREEIAKRHAEHEITGQAEIRDVLHAAPGPDRQSRPGDRGRELDAARGGRRSRFVNLIAIADALAGLTDIELHAVIAATNDVPQVATGVLAWIEGACNWELSRRAGREYKLLPPEATIDPSDDAVNIEGTQAMRASFAVGGFEDVIKFFDALAELLKGGRHKS